jgi:hypothetical protein
MKRRLTRRILEAIVYATGMVEAEGATGCQGCGSEAEREREFAAVMAARDWAFSELRRRDRAKAE